MTSTTDFYDALAPYYHLIFADWDASIAWQGEQLDALIRRCGPPGARSVLDVACGIGTQALALAAKGYDVTASDLSPAAVERARHEARSRGLDVALTVADMRGVQDHHGRTFDVVLCADNALPHLLNDDDIARALGQFFA